MYNTRSECRGFTRFFRSNVGVNLRPQRGFDRTPALRRDFSMSRILHAGILTCNCYFIISHVVP